MTTAKQKQKALNMTALQKMDSQKFGGAKLVKVHGYDILIDEVFRPSKLAHAFAEYRDRVILASQQEDIESDKIDWPTYLLMLLVKHFTNVQIPDDLEGQVAAYIYLIDNGFLEPIVAQFGKDNATKVNDALKTFSANMEAYAAEVAQKVKPEVV